MATSKPVVVIVPGGWHPASCYDLLVTQLKNANVEVLVANLPSLNPAQPLTATCTQDAEAIRQEVLLPLIANEGRDVLLVNHSYGGIPGGGAAYGLSKVSRARANKKGGIVESFTWSLLLYPKPSMGLSEAGDLDNSFYNDVDSELAATMKQSLLPHALKAFESVAPSPAWKEEDFHGRLAFLRCTQDRALPLFVQDMFMDKSGVKWVVKDIDGGHSAYASHSKEVADFLLEWTQTLPSV